jgi:hypothetical protein
LNYNGYLDSQISGLWQSGRLFLLSSMVSLYRINAVSGQIDLTQPAQPLIFLGSVSGSNLVQDTVNGNVRVTYPPDPKTANDITSVDQLLRKLPASGGRTALSQLRPVNVVRYTIESATIEGKASGNLFRSLWNPVSKSWDSKRLIGTNILAVTLQRNDVTSSLIQLEVTMPQIGTSSTSGLTNSSIALSMSPAAETLAGSVALSNPGSVQNPADPVSSDFKLHIHAHCAVASNTVVNNIMSSSSIIALSIQLPGLPSASAPSPFWVFIDGAAFTDPGNKTGTSPVIYQYLGTKPYPASLPQAPGTSWGSYPYSYSGKAITVSDYKGHNLFITIPGYQPVPIDAKGNKNLASAEALVNKTVVEAYQILGTASTIINVGGNKKAITGAQNGAIPMLSASNPTITGGGSGNSLKITITLPGQKGECAAIR